ncbi:hypothetical protein ACVWWG_009534 [Bradyrhizobium sp. LB7.2]
MLAFKKDETLVRENNDLVVELLSVSKLYGDTAAVADISLKALRGGTSLPAWSLWMRQDNHTAHGRRLRRSILWQYTHK